VGSNQHVHRRCLRSSFTRAHSYICVCECYISRGLAPLTNWRTKGGGEKGFHGHFGSSHQLIWCRGIVVPRSLCCPVVPPKADQALGSRVPLGSTFKLLSPKDLLPSAVKSSNVSDNGAFVTADIPVAMTPRNENPRTPRESFRWEIRDETPSTGCAHDRSLH